MITLRPTLALILLSLAPACLPTALHAQGQAAPGETPAQLLTGRRADIRLAGTDLSGELLALESDTLWIRADGIPLGLPVADVQRVRIHRHSLDTGAVLTWTLVGAGVTALGMTAACTSVDDANCAAVAPLVLLGWAVGGGLFAATLARSSRRDVPVAPAALRPYLRFPTGLPTSQRPDGGSRDAPGGPGGG